MNQSKTLLPYLASAACAIIWGFSFVFTKNTLDYLSVFQLVGIRFFFAAAFMSLLRLFGLIKINLKGKDLKPLFSIALFQPVLYFIAETLGVNYTTSAEAGVILALVPAVVSLQAFFMLKERLTVKQIFYVLLSFVGVVVIALSSESNGSSQFFGYLMLIGAVVTASTYQILSRKASAVFQPIETTYIMMLVGALVFNIIGIIQAAANGGLGAYLLPLTMPPVVINIIYLGIISSVLAFLFQNYALQHLEASKSAVFINLVPLISLAAGIVIRNESFTYLQYAGTFLILFGVWGRSRQKD